MTPEILLKEHVPRVSVVMGVHRVDPYLGTAIDSVLSQTFPDFEFLIVVNEACPEAKAYVLEHYADERRIRILDVPALGGLAFALNTGIGHARGEYIARMDGDDVSLPTRFEEQVRYLEANPDVVVVGCRIEMIDSNSKKIERSFPYYRTDREIRRVLPFRNPMAHPALLFRKSALHEVRGYMNGHPLEDYEMLLRIAQDPRMKFYNLDKVLFAYRRHEQQVTNPQRAVQAFSERGGVLFSEFLRTYSLKYLLAILVLHPWVHRARLLVRGWRRGTKA